VKLAKYIRFPTPDGPVKIKTRAYRRWRKETRGVYEAAWPGEEIIDAADEQEAYTLARDPSALRTPTPPLCGGDPSALRTPVPYTSYTSLFLDSKKEERSPTFICLSLGGSVAHCEDTTFKLWTILAAHARVRRTRKVKLTAEMYRFAGIFSHGAKARVLRELERRKFVRLSRRPGQSPVATVKLDRHGYPTPFAET
jgi:hypothetical protein